MRIAYSIGAASQSEFLGNARGSVKKAREKLTRN